MTQLATQVLFVLLRQQGITNVVVPFSGSGDEGAVQDALFYQGMTCLEKTPTLTREDGRDVDLLQIFTDTAQAILQAKGIDYYNNDGGEGSIDFRLETGVAQIDYGYFEQTLTDEKPIVIQAVELEYE